MNEGDEDYNEEEDGGGRKGGKEGEKKQGEKNWFAEVKGQRNEETGDTGRISRILGIFGRHILMSDLHTQIRFNAHFVRLMKHLSYPARPRNPVIHRTHIFQVKKRD